jgi:hypothetical protein
MKRQRGVEDLRGETTRFGFETPHIPRQRKGLLQSV